MDRHAFVCVCHRAALERPLLPAWCGIQPACQPQLLPIIFRLHRCCDTKMDSSMSRIGSEWWCGRGCASAAGSGCATAVAAAPPGDVICPISPRFLLLALPTPPSYFFDTANVKNGGNRWATVLMYLTDVEEGGETGAGHDCLRAYAVHVQPSYCRVGCMVGLHDGHSAAML